MRSKRSTASATASRKAQTGLDDSQLRWSRGWSLTTRILAVNLFAVLMLAGGILYLDSFRLRLLEQRQSELQAGAFLVAISIENDSAADLRRQIAAASLQTGTRIRMYGADGRRGFDSWALTGPTYRLREPETEPWQFRAARTLDRIIEGVGGADPIPYLDTAAPDRRQTFPEAAAAIRTGRPTSGLRLAPDRTPMIYAAAPLPNGRVLTMSTNARDVTEIVRDERQTLFFIFLGVVALSMFVSSFLARTIVRPLRRLALAAQRVRLGRSREVTVPRFKKRRDEIGELARSLSDMTAALRMRIDATEAFAADVVHELKNPLASLRSAVEALGGVSDPAQRGELIKVVKDDVARIDRLIGDISDASRLDAELSRAMFAAVDLGEMARALVEIYRERGLERQLRIALDVPPPGAAIVIGDDNRLAQVARNLVDNALSFSPDGGTVAVTVIAQHGRVHLTVEDSGPGIPSGAEEKIFTRFYSERPEAEGFGQHSGLGLAIARAIVDAHDGTLIAGRAQGQASGAQLDAVFPAARA